MTDNDAMKIKPQQTAGQRLKSYLLEVLIGFFFAMLMGIAYFGSGFELKFIYQGF